MLRRQLGFEAAGLQYLPCFGHEIHGSFPPGNPHAPRWRESMIDHLKKCGEVLRTREHASGVQDALSRRRAEFVMATLLETLKDGEDMPTFDFVRGVPPVLSPDIGWLATRNLAEVSFSQMWKFHY